MKSSQLATIIALLAIGFFMIACSEQKTTGEKVKTETAKVESLVTTPKVFKNNTEDRVKNPMTFPDEQMAEYKQKVTEKMALFNYKQREIQTKLAMMNEQAKANLAPEAEELKLKRAQMDAKILELYSSGGEALGDLKKGMDNAMEDMEKAYDQALERFQKE